MCYVDQGVTQAGVLSPSIFKVYIDNVLSDISNMNQGSAIGTTTTNIIVDTDNTVLC